MTHDTKCQWNTRENSTIQLLNDQCLMVDNIRQWNVICSRDEMIRHTRKDKIRNKCIWEKVEVAPIEKIMVTHLRWFGHMRRTIQTLARNVDQVEDNSIKSGKRMLNKT